ncbi:MAG TPA: D-alanyl-D-alanine carboxypeptidase [Candidatus Baltobacteraceae bacterium]|nr:D-alanyl-D-alanine carboxypeptidase [Candidatus Baltobacteraceae bacterium]
MQKSTRYLPLLTIFSASSLIFASSVSAAPAPRAGAVPAGIRAILNKPQYRNAVWTLRVMDGNTPLVDLNSQRLLYIGSVRKIFSVGELLDAVGSAHTFNTPIYRTGSISNGVLRGNIVLVASGDLTMGGRTNPDGTLAVSDWDHNEADSLGNAVLTKPNPLAGYAELARAVRASGITRIAGNIVIDDRLFKPFPFRGQFDVPPIFVNDDVVDIAVRPGGTPGSPANLTYRPHSAALRVYNKVRVGAPASKESLQIDPELPSCIGSFGCASTVSGTVPSDFKPPLTGGRQLVQTVRIVHPANYARTMFVEQLRAAGVRVDAPAVQQNPVRLLPARNAYARLHRVAQLVGMPYGQDAKFVLKISYNIGADTSLMLLGVQHGARTMQSALAFERRDLQTRWGIAPTQYHFVDGSGGGETTATAAAVTTMLQELARSRESQAFTNALPVLAVDGSLGFVTGFKRQRSLAGAAGNVRAKTGTYVGKSASGRLEIKTQALGGYVTTKRGHRLTFEVAVNGVPMNDLEDLTNIFQDEGTIAAILWRDY